MLQEEIINKKKHFQWSAPVPFPNQNKGIVVYWEDSVLDTIHKSVYIFLTVHHAALN